MDERRLLEFRRQKDQFFRHGHHSPIPEHLRPSFHGLDYYPPRPDLDLELDLEPGDGAELRLGTSDGAERLYRRAGKVHFAVDGAEVELSLYASWHQHDEDGLFLPFRDATSSTETYGAGRYLDIEPPQGAKVRIDFNLAYNPSCVYDDIYSCPLPPPENWLPVPIRAGEKDFRKDQV